MLSYSNRSPYWPTVTSLTALLGKELEQVTELLYQFSHLSEEDQSNYVSWSFQILYENYMYHEYMEISIDL